MKLKVAFICVHNSCRSQIAEGWANYLGSDILEAYSAGTEEYPQIKPLAKAVMQENNIDLSSQYPKLLSDIPQNIDLVITMGCNVSCPSFPSKWREDWGLEDPSEKGIEEFRRTSEIIKIKMQDLIKRINSGTYKSEIITD